MIRPLTIATFLLAAGSGLYLYQSKHEVQLLDRTIERTVHDTAALREQSRLLAAEWTMLNDPERLRQFSDTYLSLRTISPAQFTSVTDLDSRLPAPQAEIAPPFAEASQREAAPPATPEIAPQISAPIAETEPASVPEQPLPIPPIPTVRPIVATTAIPHPAEPKSTSETKAPFETKAPSETKAIDRQMIDRTAMARPVAPDAQFRPATPTDSHLSEQYPYDQRPAPKFADAHPDARTPPRQVAFSPARPPLPAPGPVNGPPPITPSQQQTAPRQPAPLNGSLLGMAHGSLPPAPRPTPVIATYNSN